MTQIEIIDVETAEDIADIYCKDREGFHYRFSVDYERGKLISLLLHNVYLPTNNIYEVLIKLIEMIGFSVHSVVIIEGYKDRAALNIADGTAIKSLPISVTDAFVLGLFTNAPMYIKKDSYFLKPENLEKYIWYRFLKELDLC